jgi:hypothetical protein
MTSKDKEIAMNADRLDLYDRGSAWAVELVPGPNQNSMPAPRVTSGMSAAG